jgi:hypothetical protein
MGFFGNKQPATPTAVSSILPDVAKNEIIGGRLPQLNTDRIFLKKGELCHYIDKAILLVPKTRRSYHGTRIGIPIPGLRGVRLSHGVMNPQEHQYHEHINGILYITNQRTVFEAKSNGFSKPHTSIVSIMPYADAVDMQYGTKHFCFMVPNGTIIEMVHNILRK